MVRLDLGGGAVAFEIEGEADRVSSFDPGKLIGRGWPQEVIENYRRYRSRWAHVDADSDNVVGVEGYRPPESSE